MEVQNYTGVLADIIAAINDAGSPPSIQRIQVTAAEMKEIVRSQAFRIAVSNYYGGTSALTLEGITTGIDGNIISMYLAGICIAVGPYVPTGALAALSYGPLTETGKATSTFVIVGEDGKSYMLSGIGNPGDDFIIGKNADIELGLAIRKYNDTTYYGDGHGLFEIELDTKERWTFAVTVGSLNAEIPNVTDMYDISLHMDTDPNNTDSSITWNLMQTHTPEGPNYVWYNSGSRIVDDSPTNEALSVTQMIQQYAFRYINDYVPASVERNAAGSPFGEFAIVLEAKPKFGNGASVFVEAMASISKKL